MIERRKILAAVAIAVVTPAFAQTRPRASASARRAVSGPEEQQMQMTTTIGSLSLAVSRLADQKASFPKLKEFAGFEVAEQETVAGVLKSLQNPDIANGTVQPPSEAEVEQHLDQHGRDALQKLRSAKEGRDFDRMYLDAEVEGHEQLLHVQEQYLSSGHNLDVLNVAKLVRGMVKEHLQLLADIMSEMNSISTTGAAPGNR